MTRRIFLLTPLIVFALFAVVAAPAAAQIELPNPIQCNTATCLISQVIRYILGIIAILATLQFIWGGVMMIMASGNAEQIQKAKSTLTWAVIGLFLILISWSVIKFVVGALVPRS